MTYRLRDYQQQASDAAVSFFNDKKKKTNAIMVLPTGSGKSLIIADIAAKLDGHTLVFQPSKETGWVVDLCGNIKRFGKVEDLHLHNSGNGKWAVYSKGRQLTNVWF